MSARDFCWVCGARIICRGRIPHQAKCEAGHEIPEALICTISQYRALADLRGQIDAAKADPVPGETPASIEAAFEDAIAARRGGRAIVGNLPPSCGSAVTKAPQSLATIRARAVLNPGLEMGAAVYLVAAHVVAIRPALAVGSYVTLSGGPAIHVADDAEVLRGRVDFALCALARLGRGG